MLSSQQENMQRRNRATRSEKKLEKESSKRSNKGVFSLGVLVVKERCLFFYCGRLKAKKCMISKPRVSVRIKSKSCCFMCNLFILTDL